MLRKLTSTVVSKSKGSHAKQQFAVPKIGRQEAASYFSTYYDSQSGLHVPVHNEEEITLIVDKSSNNSGASPFVPQQLYKEDASSDMPDQLQELTENGIHGIKLPPATFPRDVRNLKTLSDIKPSSTFQIFVPVAESQKIPPVPGISTIFDYQCLTTSSSQEISSAADDGSIKTTIAFNHEDCTSSEPISIANQVATLIDSKKLGDYLWLSPSGEADADDVIRLYEELIYLDVAGPTIKSRLIMETLDRELIEEAMMSGINKFAIPNESEIELVEEIAQDLGKHILRTR